MRTQRVARWRDRTWLVILTAVAFLWPAFMNGGPFWFPDTPTYIRAADAAAVTVTGERTEWSDRLIRRMPHHGAIDTGFLHEAEGAGRAKLVPERPVISGRSIYYGLLLYFPMLLFGMWGSVIVQSLAVSAIIVGSLLIALRATPADPRIAVAVIVAVLTTLTPLPYYTCMLMPDVYAGVLILALTTVLMFWRQMNRGNRVFLVGASAAIATFHTTHILIAAALAAGAFLAALRNTDRFLPLKIGTIVIAAAIVGEIAFASAVRLQLGQAPLGPPFLSARITASGPGTTFLRKHCPLSREKFALCAYRDRLPLHSDSFLWSKKPETGLFQLVDPREQRRIADEDKAFFLAVLSDDPVAVISTSVRSFGEQLVAFDLVNFNYSRMFKADMPARLPVSAEDQVAKSRAFAGSMPVALIVGATVASSLSSLALLAWILGLRVRHAKGALPPLQRFALLLVFGVLANAAICGMLSKPGARYQMRLIWLLPVAAAASVLATRRESERGRERDAHAPANC